MSKKKKKEYKKAMKFLTHNKIVLSNFRVIFGMKDYDDDEVKDTIKYCIEYFKDNCAIDPKESKIERMFNRSKREREDERKRLVADEFSDIRISSEPYTPDGKKSTKVVCKTTKLDDIFA